MSRLQNFVCMKSDEKFWNHYRQKVAENFIKTHSAASASILNKHLDRHTKIKNYVCMVIYAKTFLKINTCKTHSV